MNTYNHTQSIIKLIGSKKVFEVENYLKIFSSDIKLWEPLEKESSVLLFIIKKTRPNQKSHKHVGLDILSAKALDEIKKGSFIDVNQLTDLISVCEWPHFKPLLEAQNKNFFEQKNANIMFPFFAKNKPSRLEEVEKIWKSHQNIKIDVENIFWEAYKHGKLPDIWNWIEKKENFTEKLSNDLFLQICGQIKNHTKTPINQIQVLSKKWTQKGLKGNSGTTEKWQPLLEAARLNLSTEWLNSLTKDTPVPFEVCLQVIDFNLKNNKIRESFLIWLDSQPDFSWEKLLDIHPEITHLFFDKTSESGFLYLSHKIPNKAWEIPNKQNEFILPKAVKKEEINKIKILLEKGVSPNLDHDSLFKIALKNFTHNPQLIMLLMEYGTDYHLQEKEWGKIKDEILAMGRRRRFDDVFESSMTKYFLKKTLPENQNSQLQKSKIIKRI